MVEVVSSKIKFAWGDKFFKLLLQILNGDCYLKQGKQLHEALL